MRVTVVSPVRPDGVDDGVKMPVDRLIRQLSRTFQVVLACPDGPVDPVVPDSVRVVSLPVAGRFERATAVASGVPYSVTALGSAAKRCLEQEISRTFPDILVYYLVSTTRLGPTLGVQNTLVVQDVIHNLMATSPRSASSVMRMLAAPVVERQMRRWEKRTYPRFDRLAVVSSSEAEMLANLLGATAPPIVVVPNGVDLPEATTPLPQGNVIGYLGSFAGGRNVAAARRLVQDILPLVQDRIADASVLLLGHAPPPEVHALARLPEVELRASVPDLSPHLDECAVIVNPQTTGTGIKNSVLAAMAHGRPVVATPAALVGIDGERGRHFIEATTDAQIAHAVTAILLDRERQSCLAEAGRALVAGTYDWESYARGVVPANRESGDRS